MDDDERREILGAVADGRLTPEEAAVRLQPNEPPRIAVDGRVSELRVVATGTSVLVLADPDVHEVSVEGQHQVHRDGDVLVVEQEVGDGIQAAVQAVVDRARAFTLRDPGVRPRQRDHIEPHPRLTLRMNPTIPLDLRINAGSVKVIGVQAPICCNVTAASARLERFHGPIRCTISAGSLHADGIIDDGASELRCDAGSVDLHLEHGSSVRITRAGVTPGRLNLHLPDAGSDGPRMQVGDGRGTLEINGSTSAITVRADG